MAAATFDPVFRIRMVMSSRRGRSRSFSTRLDARSPASARDAFADPVSEKSATSEPEKIADIRRSASSAITQAATNVPLSDTGAFCRRMNNEAVSGSNGGVASS